MWKSIRLGKYPSYRLSLETYIQIDDINSQGKVRSKFLVKGIRDSS